ncbi:hypothetical protein [Marinilabilia sp.]|uniref:hypothetical protein n=1 Tax=Marinilabilia sp. TaxID=2021252 RepID=UPI0025C5CFF5|nr:hypothetical protein [Marinilabilia sp.]
MYPIERNLINTVREVSKKLHNDTKVKEFEKADNDFSKLVKSGFAHRRGNNLLSITEMHNSRYSINTSFKKEG